MEQSDYYRQTGRTGEGLTESEQLQADMIRYTYDMVKQDACQHKDCSVDYDTVEGGEVPVAIECNDCGRVWEGTDLPL